jgi:hypothetical protein
MASLFVYGKVGGVIVGFVFCRGGALCEGNVPSAPNTVLEAALTGKGHC